MRALLLASATMLLALPGTALAQHAGHDMSMPMPEPTAVPAADPHAGHDSAIPEPDPGQAAPAEHTGHGADQGHAMPETETGPGNMPAPQVPTDHAADALFDPSVMARSRRAMAREMRFTGSMVLVDRLELQGGKGPDQYRWGIEAWLGGDIDRLQLKSEGEGAFGESVEHAEVQALWSHAVSPFWNLQAGVRHDFSPDPQRTYAVVGIEGMAPYWLHLSGQLFLSDKGDLRARVEGSHDMRITQRLILQPRLELNLSAQDMPAIGVGAGLTDFALGARLRYELRPELAPYVGAEWNRQTGETARLSRLAGEDPGAVRFVAGIRFWF